MDREIDDAITTATDTGTARRGWSQPPETEKAQLHRRNVFVAQLTKLLEELPDEMTVAEIKERLRDGS